MLAFIRLQQETSKEKHIVGIRQEREVASGFAAQKQRSAQSRFSRVGFVYNFQGAFAKKKRSIPYERGYWFVVQGARGPCLDGFWRQSNQMDGLCEIRSVSCTGIMGGKRTSISKSGSRCSIAAPCATGPNVLACRVSVHPAQQSERALVPTYCF